MTTSPTPASPPRPSSASRPHAVAAALLALVLAGALLVVTSAGVASAADPPAHQVAAEGSGVGMFPAFDPGTSRYAVTTTDGSGSVTVRATTDDPSGMVRVNGRETTADTTEVSGLEAGEEISVLIDDAGGSTAYALVYLPAGFPTLQVPTHDAGADSSLVGLTLTQWNTPADSFETVVDRNGVPVHVLVSGSADLKRQPGGGPVTVFRTLAGDSEPSLVLLDDQRQPTASYQTVGLVDTDTHDAEVLPNGNLLLLAYEPDRTDPDAPVTHAVIQERTPGGEVVFEWSSADFQDESLFASDRFGPSDYAHINSVQVTADGDLLASFRHFSSVFKIARTAHDGYQQGEVIWRLGGRGSDFSFVDDPHAGGPCAQHTAYEIANGNIVIYDNGSGGIGANMCIDPADPQGDPIARTSTRVTEYALDEASGTATLVWSWAPPGRYAFFAGSAQRLANGNTLTGWAAQQVSLATEVDPTGAVVWELRDAAAASGPPFYSTYRAAAMDLPDALDPEVVVDLPGDGGPYDVGEDAVAEVTCTDAGGSTLQTCDVSPGHALDTSSAGRQTLTVEATDGAGNATTVRRRYRVGSARPDAMARRVPRGSWRGDDVYGGRAGQTVTTILRRGRTGTAKLKVVNDGSAAGRFLVQGKRSGRGFRVTYLSGPDRVTGPVTQGTWRTPRLDPGEHVVLTVRVLRTRNAAPGTSRVFWVRATGVPGSTDGSADTAALRVRARR